MTDRQYFFNGEEYYKFTGVTNLYIFTLRINKQEFNDSTLQNQIQSIIKYVKK